MKTLSIAFAGLIIVSGTAMLASLNVNAAESKVQTIESLYKNRNSLVGKEVTAQGKVVKVNNKIMNRNFVHLQDGTGDAKAGTNDLVVTSKQTAMVGDQISISGVMVVNRDFGYGYSFPILIEDTRITPK